MRQRHQPFWNNDLAARTSKAQPFIGTNPQAIHIAFQHYDPRVF
jgi:hypothetical protein